MVISKQWYQACTTTSVPQTVNVKLSHSVYDDSRSFRSFNHYQGGIFKNCSSYSYLHNENASYICSKHGLSIGNSTSRLLCSDTAERALMFFLNRCFFFFNK